ncbi:MAG TPA: AI-2E family transporter [Cyclobacteriaceae bacterium]|nr:AI-2E family transporter [Cyclobacteriaceae bacterium]
MINRRIISTSGISITTVLQVMVYGGIVLVFGKPLLIPLSFAMLISFILFPVCNWLERKSLSRMSAILFSMSILMMIVSGIVFLLIQQFISFLNEWTIIKEKLVATIEDSSIYLFNTFHINREQQNQLLKELVNQSGGNIISIIRQMISVYSLSLVLVILVPIYSVLILYYRTRLVKALYMVFPIESRVGIKKILSQTITAYYNFIKGMGIVYFVVGTLNSLGLLLIGVPHAILFGYIAAILTFIPYVGIIVGSLLPITMAWITYSSIWYPLGVVALFSFVQYLEANLIFPLAVSNRLKINALVTLVAIILGGVVWGVAGMILFVPFLAIAKLITDNSPRLKTWSTLLGTS